MTSFTVESGVFWRKRTTNGRNHFDFPGNWSNRNEELHLCLHKATNSGRHDYGLLDRNDVQGYAMEDQRDTQPVAKDGNNAMILVFVYLACLITLECSRK